MAKRLKRTLPLPPPQNKKEQNINLWKISRCLGYVQLESQIWKCREKEQILKEIITEMFPNLIKLINPDIQEV